MAGNTTIKVALDWTPNTIHTGLFVALEKGFYAKHGLHVQLLSPDPSYSTTPAKRVENGDADLAVCPSESCIAYAESGKMHLQAIYAILQKDASAIVSINPKFAKTSDLERGTYGSYNARYEDHIVRSMVNTDGGDGSKMQIASSVGKLSLFEEVKQQKVDATWVFMPWEGVEAELDGTKLNVFKTQDYGVPYGYSPVIARNATASTPSAKDLEAFVHATREGYAYAKSSPFEAVTLLGRHCEPARSEEFLGKSQKMINAYYGDEPGLMTEEKWSRFVEWLKNQSLLKAHDVVAEKLYTNEFF